MSERIWLLNFNKYGLNANIDIYIKRSYVLNSFLKIFQITIKKQIKDAKIKVLNRNILKPKNL